MLEAERRDHLDWRNLRLYLNASLSASTPITIEAAPFLL